MATKARPDQRRGLKMQPLLSSENGVLGMIGNRRADSETSGLEKPVQLRPAPARDLAFPPGNPVKISPKYGRTGLRISAIRELDS
jgi:hypothetical protein